MVLSCFTLFKLWLVLAPCISDDCKPNSYEDYNGLSHLLATPSGTESNNDVISHVCRNANMNSDLLITQSNGVIQGRHCNRMWLNENSMKWILNGCSYFNLQMCYLICCICVAPCMCYPMYPMYVLLYVCVTLYMGYPGYVVLHACVTSILCIKITAFMRFLMTIFKHTT